jgi:hypothetical protein
VSDRTGQQQEATPIGQILPDTRRGGRPGAGVDIPLDDLAQHETYGGRGGGPSGVKPKFESRLPPIAVVPPDEESSSAAASPAEESSSAAASPAEESSSAAASPAEESSSAAASPAEESSSAGP